MQLFLAGYENGSINFNEWPKEEIGVMDGRSVLVNRDEIDLRNCAQLAASLFNGVPMSSVDACTNEASRKSQSPFGSTVSTSAPVTWNWLALLLSKPK